MNGVELLLNIAGGVALLLWATRMIRTGVTRAYGVELRRLLARATRSHSSALVVGCGVAGILQSSAATALLVVSFAASGLIATAPGLALMLGADIGSTFVVQILSFDVSWLSPLFILLGVVSFFSSEQKHPRQIGRVLIGLGLMLLSLKLIVGASETMRGSEVLATIVEPLADDPIFALFLGALITWIAHSSVAIVLLVMSFALAGIIPVDLAFALVLGANIGSGIIPVVLTLSADPIAKRIPLGNLLFRTVGALIMLFALEWLAPYMSHLGAEPARQVANFHTLFNLVLAAVSLPFVNLGATLVTRIYPEAKGEAGRAQTRYLDESVVDNPSLALAAASREVIRMADIVEAMLNETIKVFETNDEKRVAELSKMDDDVDHLYEEIKFYLARVSRSPLGEDDSNRCVDLITFVTNLEHIGDIIDKNLVEIARKKISKKLSFSEEGWSELTELHARVVNQMKLAMNLFVSGDLQIARLLLTEKERFRGLERGAGEKHLDRLRGGRIESIETSALHLDILRDFKRINSHLTSLAYPVLDAEGELRESRLRVTVPKEA